MKVLVREAAGFAAAGRGLNLTTLLLDQVAPANGRLEAQRIGGRRNEDMDAQAT